MRLPKKTEVLRFTADNSPLLLTVAGTGAIVATGVTAYRAGYENGHNQYSLRDKEDLREGAWRPVVSPIFSGIVAIGCIISVQQIGVRRAAALAAAYTISDQAFQEYKAKVVETLGKKREQGIRDTIAQDRVDRTKGSSEIVIASGKVLCMDLYSGRYFESTVEAIRQAQNDLNYTVLNDGYASLSQFYELVGLAPTKGSEEVGWVSMKLMEIKFSTVLSQDGKPCVTIDFAVEPCRNYYKFD